MLGDEKHTTMKQQTSPTNIPLAPSVHQNWQNSKNKTKFNLRHIIRPWCDRLPDSGPCLLLITQTSKTFIDTYTKLGDDTVLITAIFIPHIPLRTLHSSIFWLWSKIFARNHHVRLYFEKCIFHKKWTKNKCRIRYRIWCNLLCKDCI